MDFTGKVVLITGASSGIGAASAIYFSKLSAKLVLVGRNDIKLQETASKCENEKGITPLTVVADMTIEADIERIVNETIGHFKRLDVLVNNAGISRVGDIQRTTLKTYDDIMNTNVRGPFYLTKLAVPHLIKTHGSIVNVSSILSLRTHQNLIAYSMSKAAMDHFTRNLAYSLGPEGVRVNCVNPGLVVTDIMNRMGLNDKTRQKIYEDAVAIAPLGRLAEADDVAASIAFFASDLAKSITGTILPVDGGRVTVS